MLLRTINVISSPAKTTLRTTQFLLKNKVRNISAIFPCNHFSQQSHWAINLHMQDTSHLTNLSGQYSTISVGSLSRNSTNFPTFMHCKRCSRITLSLFNRLDLISTTILIILVISKKHLQQHKHYSLQH